MRFIKNMFFKKKQKLPLEIGQVYKIKSECTPNPGPWPVPDQLVKIRDLKDGWVRYDYLAPYDVYPNHVDCRLPENYFRSIIECYRF